MYDQRSSKRQVVAAAFSVWCLAVPCATGCPPEEADRIVRQGFESTASGTCEAEGGNFIVSVVRISEGNAEESRLRALRDIGAVLGVSVSTREAAGYSEKTDGGRVEFDSFFRSATSASIDQALAGVQGRGVIKGNGDSFAVYVLSDRTIESARSISRAAAKRPDGPVVVEALGLAMIRDGRLEVAKRQATESALRQAVEMVSGATLVAQSAVREDDESREFRDQVASVSLGLVDNYEVVRQGQDGDYYSVVVRATVVPKKLLDNFNSILRAMGDPVFAIDAGDDQVLEDMLAEFFRDKGLRLSGSMRDAAYIIKARSSYSSAPDPRDRTGDRTGTRGQLRLDIVNAETAETLGGDLRTDGRATSFVRNDPVRQRELVCETMLRRSGQELHEKLQEFIEREMAGRRIRVAVVGVPALQDPQLRERVAQGLEDVSFIEDVQAARASGSRFEFDVLLRGRDDQLAADLIRVIKSVVPDAAISLLDQTPHQLMVGVR